MNSKTERGIALGRDNVLEVLRITDIGAFLDGDNAGDILLPRKYMPADLKEGDHIKVFVYLDQEERLIATTETPLVKVGEFAHLQVAWVNQYGAFLHWGLLKDLFCPFAEQRIKMEVGYRYPVYVYVDEDSYRIVASARLDRFVDKTPALYEQGDEVDLLIVQKTDLGYKVVIDNRYMGLVYSNQIFRKVAVGERTKGYILWVREDGKIDVSLQPLGRKQTLDFAEELLVYLQEHEGYCALGDKSDAEAIKQCFGVSKKTFKKAVGDLYKRHLITFDEHGGLRLL